MSTATTVLLMLQAVLQLLLVFFHIATIAHNISCTFTSIVTISQSCVTIISVTTWIAPSPFLQQALLNLLSSRAQVFIIFVFSEIIFKHFLLSCVQRAQLFFEVTASPATTAKYDSITTTIKVQTAKDASVLEEISVQAAFWPIASWLQRGHRPE